jgi:hypothetical protein
MVQKTITVKFAGASLTGCALPRRHRAGGLMWPPVPRTIAAFSIGIPFVAPLGLEISEITFHYQHVILLNLKTYTEFFSSI